MPAPVFDAVGAASNNFSGTASVNFTWTHTPVGTPTAAFVVHTTYDSDGNQVPSTYTRTVTYGGQAMTLMAGPVLDNNGPSGTSWIEIYGLLDPPSGAQTCSVTIAKTGANLYSQGNSISYTGCGGVGTKDENYGQGSYSQEVTTAVTGETILNAVSGGGDFASYNKTLRWSVASGATSNAVIIGEAAGAASVTFTASQAGWWSGLGLPLQPGAPPTTPYVVTQAAAAISASRSPAIDFTTYTPVENDVVVVFPSSATTATITNVAGWTNPLGSGVDVESDAHQISCGWHKVTAAEVSGGTHAWTLTNWYDATESGNIVGCVIRNVDPDSVVDSVNSTFDSTNTVTPHVLASLTGTNLSDDSLVISCVAKDGTGAYTTQPAGWTFVQTDNNNQGKALLSRDALTVAGNDVAATNITPSGGDEYASITIAFTKAPPAGLPPVNEDDPVGATDALTKTQNWVRTPADPVGATDSVAKGTGRAYSDSVGLTDSATIGFGRTVTDAVGVTDALTKGAGRTSVNPLGVADTLTATQDYARTVADPMGITDSVTVGLALTSDTADPIGITDALTWAVDATRTAADPVGVGDSLSTVSDTTQVFADPLGITDLVGVQQDWARTAADEIGVGDSLTAVISLTSTTDDAIGITDNLDTVTDCDRAATDQLDVADSLTVGAGRIPADSAGVTDALSTIADYQRLSDDPIGITDYAVFDLAGSGEVVKTDLIGIADTLVRVADAQRTDDDPIGVTDSTSVGQGHTITDAVGVDDELALTSDAFTAVADPISITDAVIVDLSGADESNHTNPIGVTDAVARVADAQRAADDDIGITDSATADITLAASAADTVGLADTLGLVCDTEKTYADPVGVDDTVGLSTDYERAWTNPVGVADSATFILGRTAALTDPVDVSDELVLVAAAERAWTDPVGVADSAVCDLSAARPEDLLALTDSAIVDMWGPADPDRTHPVRAQSRIFGVRPESRTYAVKSEPRTTSP